MSVGAPSALGAILSRILSLGRTSRVLKLYRLPTVASSLKKGEEVEGLVARSGWLGVKVKGRKAHIRVPWEEVRKFDPEASRHFGKATSRLAAQEVAAPLQQVVGGMPFRAAAPSPFGLLGAGEAAAANPALAGTGAVLTGAFLLPKIVDTATRTTMGEAPFAEAAGTELGYRSTLQRIQQQRRIMALRRAEIESIQRTMAENMARLAAVAPHIYNQVLAGQRLPKGAVVLGGDMNTGALEELAMHMMQGQPQTSEDELAQLIGE